MCSHSYASNIAVNTNKERLPGEVVWTPLPLFHLNAAVTTVLATAFHGSQASIHPRFSLSGFWGEVERSGARIVSLLGAMIPLAATMPDTPEMLRCTGQIRIAGGAPYTPEVARIRRERFGVSRVGSSVFGLTETTFLTSTPVGVEPPPGTAGMRNDDFDVRIFDDHDRELPDGEVGEIVARPLKPHVMFDGYWRRPDATAATMRNMVVPHR
jgi:crotonobetaine/carnitine-CoA ligase